VADPADIVAQYESKRRPYIGWGDVDLTNAPLSPTGFPQWPGRPGPRGQSHAAGLYQFEPGTWDPVATRLGITDFKPESQRRVFDEVYREGGYGAWAPYNPRLAAAVGWKGDGLQREGEYGGATHVNVFGGRAPGQDTPQPDNLAAGVLLDRLLGGGGTAEPEQPDPMKLLDQLLSNPGKEVVPPVQPATARPPVTPAPVAAQPPGPTPLTTTPMQPIGPPAIPHDSPAGNLLNTLLGISPAHAETTGAPPKPAVLPASQGEMPHAGPIERFARTQPAPSDEEITATAQLGATPSLGRRGQIVAGAVADVGMQVLDDLLAAPAALERGIQPGETPREALEEPAQDLAMMMAFSGGGRGGLGAGMRFPGRRGVQPERIEPSFEPPPMGHNAPPEPMTPDRSAIPTGGAGRGGGSPGGEPPPRDLPKIEPPAGIGQTAQRLDDDLYKLEQNGHADMRQAEQMLEAFPKEWLNPEFQERAYTEAEARMVRRDAPLSPEVMRQERALADIDAEMNRIATKLRTKLGADADMIPELPTAEEGYVHRKQYGRPGPGEKLDPLQPDTIAGGGGRSLSRVASATMKRDPWFVAEDELGNRTWSHKKLGEPGAPAAYGDTFPMGGKEWTARPPTTAEIEGNTNLHYIKNRLANTIDGWLRLKRVERNVDLLDRWKPQLQASQLWRPEAERGNGPHGWVHVDLPQMKGWADPRIGHTLNDFYKRAGHDGFLGALENANHFLIGSMFAVPFGHMRNVRWHYTIGRGWDWARSNPQLFRAFRSVTTQDADAIRLLRAGAGMQYPRVLNEDFYARMMERTFRDQLADPNFERNVAQRFGVKVKDLVKAEYRASRKMLWWFNDVLVAARAFELEAKGMPLDRALRQVGSEIPDYRIPSHIIMGRDAPAGSLREKGGRLAADALKQPLVTAFGRYTYGRYRAVADMAKDILGPGRSGQQRIDGIGQAVVMATLIAVNATLVKYALNKAFSSMGYTGRPLQPSMGGPGAMIEATMANLGFPITPDERDFWDRMSSYITIAPGLPLLVSLAQGARNYFGQKMISPQAGLKAGAIEGLEAVGDAFYPTHLLLESIRKGPVAGLGPAFGFRQERKPMSPKMRAILNRQERSRERKDPVQQLLR
jgi:hypothetical protein